MKGNLRSRIFWISLVFLALFAGLATLYVNHQVRKGLVKLSADLLEEFEKNYGFSVSYDRLNVNLFHYLQIDNLALERQDESLRVRKIRLYVAWWRFLFFEKSLDLVSLVDISDVDVKLVHNASVTRSPSLATEVTVPTLAHKEFQERVKNLTLDLFTILQNTTANSEALNNVNIQLKRVNLELIALWGKLNVKDLYAFFNAKTDKVSIDLQANVAPELPSVLSVPLDVRLRGSLYPNGNLGELLFSITPPKKFLSLAQDLSFRALWQDQVLTISKTIDSIPLAMIFKIDLNERSLYSNLSAQSLDIAKFITLSNPDTPLSSYWNGGFSVLYYPDSGVAYYNATGNFETRYGKIQQKMDVNLSGNNLATEIKNFSFGLNENGFSYQGSWNLQNKFPDGVLALSTQVKQKPLEGLFRIDNKKNMATLSTQSFTFDNKTLGEISGQLTRSRQGDYVGSIAFENPSGHKLEAYTKFEKALDMAQLSFSAKEFPLLDFARVGLLPGFFAKWFFDSELAVVSQANSFFIDGSNISLKQDEKHMISTSFIVNNDVINISNLMVTSGNFFTRLTLDMKRGLSEFNGLMNVLDTDYPISGNFTDNGLEMNGQFGYVNAHFKDKRIKIDLTEFPVGIHNEKDKTITVLGDLSWGKAFNLSIPKVIVEGENLLLDVRDVQLGADSGKIETILFKDEFSQLNGQMGYRAYQTDGELQVDGILNMTGQNGENYLLQVYHDEFWQGDLSAYRLPVERLGIEGLEGLLSTNFNFTFAQSRPQVDGYINFDGFYKNLHAVVDSSVEINESGLSLLGNHIQYGKWRFLGPVLLVDSTKGAIQVSSQITDVNGLLKTGVTMSVLPNEYNDVSSLSQIFKKDFTMLLQTESLFANQTMVLPQYIFEVKRSDQQLLVSSKTRTQAELTYQLDSQDFTLNFDDPITSLLFVADGNLMPDRFLFNVEQASGPLSILNPFLILRASGARILGFPRGEFKGSFTIDNTRSINGNFKLDGLIKSAFSPGSRFDLDHEIDIKNSMLKMEDWTFNLAQGTKMVLNVGVNLARQSLRYMANVNITGGRGAPFDFEINNYVKFRGRVIGWTQYEGDARLGYLSGRLEFPTAQGSLASLTKFISTSEKKQQYIVYKVPPPGYNILSGRNMSYDRANSQEKDIPIFNVAQEQTNNMQGEEYRDQSDHFTLVSGRDFTFYAPSMSLPTIQATLEPGEYVDLFMDITLGGEKYYYLEGLLEINRGEINYFGNKFLMQSGGTILFDQSTQFNPYLELKADYRTDTLTSRVITMNFKNHVLDKYDPQFTSIPSMPQEQIVATLGANISPGTTDNNNTVNNPFNMGAIDTAYPQALYDERERSSLGSETSLGAFEQIVRTGTDSIGGTVSRMVESAVRFIPFIDTVTVKTDLISNFALDKLSSSYTTNATGLSNNVNSFARYLDGTSIYFGTYIDKNLFFQTKFDLEEMSALSRYADASQLKVNFYVDFQVNTPFFLVDWAFNPMQNSRDVSASNSQWKFRPEVTLTFSRTFAFRDWKDLFEQFSNAHTDQ